MSGANVSDPRQVPSVRGEFLHPGVKGVELTCPKCYRTYKNCHPDPKQASFCPCDPLAPTQLVTVAAMRATQETILRWMVQSGKFNFEPKEEHGSL